MSEDMILRVLTGNDKWQKISVPASGAILGSDSDCDIILDEPTVSPKHCHIVCDKGDWGIDAIGGCTGVSVNGQKTNGSPLKEGDRIELGAMFLEVVRLPVPQLCLPHLKGPQNLQQRTRQPHV
jgi:pSer/pThr/pTyr-binding forkhead associated (FHA) protein